MISDRHREMAEVQEQRRISQDSERSSIELAETRVEAALMAGAYTRPLFQLALSISCQCITLAGYYRISDDKSFLS